MKALGYKKHLIYTLLCIISTMLGVSGCQKLFHEPDSDLNGIRTLDDAEKSVIGAYSQLAFAFGFNGSWIQSANGDDINFYALSNVYKTDDGNCNSSSNYEIYFAENYHIGLTLYQCIHSSNNLIKKLGEQNNLEKKMNYILGEAYFLRAYAYYRLSRVFGQVPLTTEPTIEYDLKNATFKELYNQIEADLLRSMQYLPSNSAESRYPHITPHVGTAKLLLAEVYLTMGGFPLYDVSKFEKAAQLSGEIIDKANIYDYELLPDMADLWKSQSKVNKENVFSLYYLRGDKYETTLGNSIPGYFYTVNRSAESTNIGYPGDKIPKAEINFYNRFPESYRKDVSYYTKITISGTKTNIESIDLCTLGQTRLNTLIRKFYIYNEQISSFNNTQITSDVLYIYRYAHVLLNYAEAKARSGQQPDEKAYECVNMIRRRANKLDIYTPSVYDLKKGLSPEQFADSVVQERAWEFCAEPEGRWFDIQRLHILDKINKLRDPSEPASPADTSYFLPFLL